MNKAILIIATPGKDGTYRESPVEILRAAEDGFTLPALKKTLGDYPALFPAVGALQAEASAGGFQIVRAFIERGGENASLPDEAGNVTVTPVFSAECVERKPDGTERVSVRRSDQFPPEVGAGLAQIFDTEAAG